MAHGNARRGPAGRRELVRLMIEMGMSEKQTGACLSVSACAAHRWKRRWLTASARERGCGRWRWIARAVRSPTRPPALVEQRLLDAREPTGWVRG